MAVQDTVLGPIKNLSKGLTYLVRLSLEYHLNTYVHPKLKMHLTNRWHT